MARADTWAPDADPSAPDARHYTKAGNTIRFINKEDTIFVHSALLYHSLKLGVWLRRDLELSRVIWLSRWWRWRLSRLLFNWVHSGYIR